MVVTIKTGESILAIHELQRDRWRMIEHLPNLAVALIQRWIFMFSITGVHRTCSLRPARSGNTRIASNAC